MNVFALTRIKLAVIYVVAVMSVSIMFSLVLYRGVSQNIEQSFIRAESRLRGVPGISQQVLRQASGEDEAFKLHQFFVEELQESKYHVIYNLFVANLLIVFISAISSYVLAGKTLRPIEDVLVEQKRFIADASHELRTPLTSLKTSIEVALRDKSHNVQTKSVLRNNLEDVDALKELINSLLQLASQENKSITKQLVDVHEVISRAIKTMKPMANEKNIKIVSKLKHQQILASETGLQQLFTILLDNAIKYSNPKGKIRIDVVPRKRNLLVKISDNGIGINKKYLPHIFDRFYRIDSSRTYSQRPGFGLGLSVAKQIVANHHGAISVMSEISKGSTFCVSLPL